jgi:hypothetical protein
MGRPTNAQRAERTLLNEVMQGPAENALTGTDGGNAAQPEPSMQQKPKSLPRITYSPTSESAPYETLWNKHRFRANVPVAVRDVVNGNTALQMIESAKTNPDFEVEGFKKAQPRAIDPETPEQYKSYAVSWIRRAVSAAELKKRWRNEKDLREECGVGTDDEEYLATIYQPRLSFLIEQEKLQTAAVND